ncbi:MAG TPA: NACHT domain-containing protein, partial [Allocoleopsis sp.]
MGEPGAGKTTMLLELAQELLDRAKRDESEPIPVILDLSTWKGSGQPMVEWLSTELQAKYGLRPDFARKWVEKQQLLPLLDGLDEVAPQHQEVSVLALRAWLTGALEPKPCGVVICCRHKEFEQGMGQFLNLYGAIDLKALTPQQIEEYLAQLDLQDVWQTVRQDAALQELLTKPLFLSMFALIAAQGKFVAQDWRSRSTSKAKAEYLLDIYWETAMARELILDPEIRKQGIRSKAYGQNPLPSRQFVRRTLVFAAKNLSRDFSADIAIENLQPSALQNQRQKRIYRLFFALADGSVCGLIAGLSLVLIYSLPDELILGLVFALALGLSYGLFSGLLSLLNPRPSQEL